VLRKKILKAREKVSGADWVMANIQKQLPEFHDLDLWTQAEMTEALETALNETEPEHYAGTRPPQQSYERTCVGAELFAFAWDSSHFRRRMYLKFCFAKETLYIVSFHKQRAAKEDL
jgi:hypothetical protein